MKNSNSNFFLFNVTIMPNEGNYSCKKVTTKEAVQLFELLSNNGSGYCEFYTSAIGHQGTVDALNNIIFNGDVCGRLIEVNRIQAQMQVGDQAIALKMRGRLPEGKILSLQEMEEVGFDFYHIERMPDIIYTPKQVHEAFCNGLDTVPNGGPIPQAHEGYWSNKK